MLSRVADALESLPGPLQYILVAVGAIGAVYSTIHHVKAWRPRKIKRLKLKGAEGKKIEDCTIAPKDILTELDSDFLMEPRKTCSKHEL
jgi:hypothetical protein